MILQDKINESVGVNLKEDEIAYRKELNTLMARVNNDAKRSSCLICGKQCSSFCNSHIIPQFVLKNIADNGHLYMGIEAFKQTRIGEPLQTKGINRLWTFKVICRDCDKKYFSDYEYDEALLHAPNNRIMAEIALKNMVMQIAKRYNEWSFYKLSDIYADIRDKEAKNEEINLDLRDYLFDFRRSKKIIDNNLKSGFILLYYNVLNYITPIAMQGPICVHRDLEGNIINDVESFDPNKRMEQLHLAVFPLKNKTVVIMFFHKDDRHYVKFKYKFDRLNQEDKLKYINYLIIKYCEHYAISPKIKTELLNDAQLRKLSEEDNDHDKYIYSSKELVWGYKYQLVYWRDIPNLLGEENRLTI